MKRSFLILASIILSLLMTSLQPVRAQGRLEPLPRFDRREIMLPPFRLDGERAAAFEALKAKAPMIVVDLHPVTASPISIRNRFGFLTGPDATDEAVVPIPGATNKVQRTSTPAEAKSDDPHAPIKAFLDRNAALFGHGAEVLIDAQITRDYVSAHNGLRTVVWQQGLDGIPIFEAVLSGHVTKLGELVSVSSGFVPAPAAAADAGTPNRQEVQINPRVRANMAVTEAAMHIGETLTAEEVEPVDPVAEGPRLKQAFKAATLQDDAQAELVWLPMNRETLRLCWRVVLTGKTRQELFQVLVDADTGELQVRHRWTSYFDSSYRVFNSDSPSPFSPGHPAPSPNQPMNINTLEPEFVSQVNVLESTVRSSEASPQGWVTSNTTVGNNVDAHTDLDGNANVGWNDPLPFPNPPRPLATDAGGVLQFHFTTDLTQAPNQNSPARNQDAAVVNAFYWCNWMHDRLYELGFTEAAGNFQQNNFGHGGVGGDAVRVEVQTGANRNPPWVWVTQMTALGDDGSPPVLTLGLIGGEAGPTPKRDDAFEAEMILHEYTHGLTTRLVGGGSGLTGEDWMAECWTDFYGPALLSQSTDDLGGAYAVGAYGTYLWKRIGFPALTENYHYGIRHYPLSNNMNVNPLTLGDIDYRITTNPHLVRMNPAFDWTDYRWYQFANVWNVTLWEARANLIAKYGFDTGNQQILQLVTDGIRLTPPHPDFIQARDALLQADYINTGGANQSELWAAFAKRGMGTHAEIEHLPSNMWLPHETFDLPSPVPLAGVTLNPNAVLRNDFTGWVGFRFRVGSVALTVTELGRLVVAGNNQSHIVRLVDSRTGSDVVGGSATVNTAGQPAGQFAFVALPNPVTLEAGVLYYLMSYETIYGDRWYNHPDCEIELTGNNTPQGAVWQQGGGPYFYDYYLRPQTYVPVNLKHRSGLGWSDEGQVPKNQMSVSSSSSYAGWDAWYAIDQDFTDPGWHSAGYANAVEYLCVDLQSSRNVYRVGYLPRVMSPSPADGTWNGVFRQYEIYVTSLYSANPADWGLPVASGEWSWPAGQERRDLIVGPKVGRYVYFRRVTAWGWHTPTYPGYANANEIWVYAYDP